MKGSIPQLSPGFENYLNYLLHQREAAYELGEGEYSDYFHWAYCLCLTAHRHNPDMPFDNFLELQKEVITI